MIDGLLAWSYDASGMAVTQVTREPCILGTAGDCYVVYMQRADLHRLSVFVPVTPGSSVTYSVTTDAMRNAVPPTITRKGAFATYTLDGTPSVSLWCPSIGANCRSTGSCLTSTPPNNAGPPATMGDVCTLVGTNGWGCATPLRNPFATDVLFPPFLLPGFAKVAFRRRCGCSRLGLM